LASIEVSEERGVRYLHFGSELVQGAMRIARPWALELEYTRELMLTVVEIDPRVVETAREFFRLPDESPRLHIVVSEGHDFLSAHKGRFDLIVVDGFDEKGRTGTLDTVSFYGAARARLARRGMMSVNLLTRRRGADASEARMREAFGDHVRILQPPEAGNTVAVMGIERPLAASMDELRRRATDLRAATGLNLAPTLARITS
jgi:spermidine synthase